jgi:hypothetical protein
MAQLASFDREIWCTACELIRAHGQEAPRRANELTERALAGKDLNDALLWMMVVEAAELLLAEPEDGEWYH